MKRCIRLIPVILLACCLVLALTHLVDMGYARDEFIPDRVVVKLKAGVSVASLEATLAGTDVKVIRDIPALNVVVLALPPGQEWNWLKRLQAEPFVEYAEPDYRVKALLEPNDSYWVYQWNMSKIEVYKAWDITTGSPEVTIAVIDTGVDLDHPEFAGKIVPGWDFVNRDPTPDDDHGHGTHVAGIAAALGNNGQGVAGVAWGARIMPLKVLDSEGNGYISDVADAIVYAANHGAKVINLSLGGYDSSLVLADAVDYAYNRGCLLVAATGNDNLNDVMYPAAYTQVMAVAATNYFDERAWYSNYGPEVEVAAPGGDGYGYIYSTGPGGGYYSSAGTSMATPHVAGLAALIWAVNPDLSNIEVRRCITRATVDLGAKGRDEYFGYGLINAYMALQPHLAASYYSSAFLMSQWEIITPSAITITLVNTSYTPLDWVADKTPDPWLHLKADGGTIWYGVEDSLVITVTRPFTYGLYHGRVFITGTASGGIVITQSIGVTVSYTRELAHSFLPLVVRQNAEVTGYGAAGTSGYSNSP